MGIGSVFKKIGKGVLKAGKVIDKIDDVVPAQVLVMIPVAGPALVAAGRIIDSVDSMGIDSYRDKQAEADHQLWKKNEMFGEDRKAAELRAIAYLVKRGYAIVQEVEE